MKDLSGLRDEDIDRLLSGKTPDADGFDDLAAFVRGVQPTYVAPPAQEAAARHIAAAAATVREQAAFREAADPGAPATVVLAPLGAAPVAGPPAPARGPSLISRWRRRTAFGVSVATMTLSIGAAAIAATATGGLAAQGDLPKPIQRVVAQAASGVGITLPREDRPAPPQSPAPAGSQGLPAGSAGSSRKAQTGAGPASTATPNLGEHDDASVAPGALPSTAPQGDDRQGRRARGDGSTGIQGGAPALAGHGDCVAFAEQVAGTLGLDEQQRPTFLSLVDHDESAVTAPVAAGAKPDAACESSITAAKAKATAGSANGGGPDDHPATGHGNASPAPKPSISPTPTPPPSGHGGSGGRGD
jgi:hypothetical protein